MQTPTGQHNAGEPYIDQEADVHLNATSVWAEGAFLRLGSPDIVTIASGVATITKGFTALAAESSTTDTVDTITVAGAAEGDLLFLVADVGDTITIDDANIDLGAATRAIGPGGCMLLRYDGASWVEVVFLTGADNA